MKLQYLLWTLVGLLTFVGMPTDAFPQENTTSQTSSPSAEHSNGSDPAPTSQKLKKVLVISEVNVTSNWDVHPWNLTFTRALSINLRSIPNITVSTFDISPNTQDTNSIAIEFEKIRSLIETEKYDAVVGILEIPCNLLMDHYNSLPPNIPIILCGYQELSQQLQDSRPNVTGIILEQSLSKTLDLALKMAPKTKQILVLTDKPKLDLTILSLVGEGTKYSKCKATLLDCSGKTKDDILAAAKALPAESLIILGHWNAEVKTDYPHTEMLVKQLSENVKIPIFAAYNTPYYLRATGGYGVAGTTFAERTVKIVLNTLATPNPTNVPFVTCDSIPIVNAYQAENLELSLKKLPSQTLTLFQPYPFWNPSKKTIIFSLTLTVLALVLLVKMVILYRRHRRFTRQITAIFDSLPVRVCVTDEKDNILFFHAESELTTQVGKHPKNLSQLNEIAPSEAHNTVRWVLGTKSPSTIHYDSADQKRVAVFSPLPDGIFNAHSVIWVSQDVTELEVERSKSAKLAEQHRITLESVGDALIVTDVVGVVRLINPVAAQLTGYMRVEAIGSPLSDIFKLNDFKTGTPINIPIIAKVLETGQPILNNDNLVLVSKQDKCYRIVCNISPILTTEGKISGTVLAFRDVTEEYVNRSRITSALQTLRYATRLANINYFAYDPVEKIWKTSKEEMPNWGYENDKPISFDKWVLPEDLQQFKDSWNDLVSEKISELNLSYRSNYTGTMRYYSILAALHTDDQTKHPQIFGVIQDVTQIGESERKYHDASSMFRTILDSLPSCVYVKDIDNDFRFTLTSKLFRETFHAKDDNPIGKTIFELTTKEIAEKLHGMDLHAVETGKMTENITQIVDTQGNPRFIKVLKTPITQSDNRHLLLGVAIDITELRETQHREKESGQLLQMILDNLSACVSAKDVNDNFSYVIWNRELEHHTGIASEKAIGKTDFELKPYPGFADDFRKMDEEVVRSGKPMRFVVDCVTSRGEKITYDSFKTPLKNPTGKTLLIDLSMDVTREKKLERDRSEMIKTLNDLIENSDITNECLKRITVESNFDKVINEVLGIVGENGSADSCYVYRYSQDYALSSCIYEWTRKGVEPQIANQQNIDMLPLPNWGRYLKDKKDIIIEDAQKPPLDFSGTVETLSQQDIKSLAVTGLWSEGKLWGFIGLDFVNRAMILSENNIRTVHNAANLFQLAQERNRQMNALADSSFQQKQIFDNISIPIALFDTHSNIVVANPSCQVIIQDTGKNVIGSKYKNGILAPEEYSHSQEIVKYAKREFIVNTQPIYDRHKNLVYVLETAVDITEINDGKRKLEEAMKAAQAADRAKSYFLATMSHEIRTPLNAVIGFSELLEEGNVSDAQRNEYLQSIHFAGNALLSLINDVLDLSKIEAEQTKVEPKRVNFVALIDEIHAIFQQAVQEKRLTLSINCARDLPLLYLDNSHMRQVLLNLMGNALKFTHNGGITISVSFTKEDKDVGTLDVKVADTGIGIKKEFREKIFEPFVQQDSIRGSRSYQGTGLGLAISRRLIRRMGGELLLESQEGKGSVFTVHLEHIGYDEDVDSIEVPTIEITTEIPDMGANYKVLLVDDVAMNLKVLSRVLENMHIQVKTANSGVQALALLDKETVNVVLTDMWMPNMNGSQLAELIKKQPKCASVKIIAVTADTDTDDSFDMSNIDDIILKPITKQKLCHSFAKLKKQS